MAKQKYKIGELVWIKEKLPHYKSHFTSGRYALVCYSYDQMYGGGKEQRNTYSLMIMKEGSKKKADFQCSWYDDDNLEKVKGGRKDKHLIRFNKLFSKGKVY